MSRSKLEITSPPDWDAFYRDGTPPWDTGRPAAELVRVLKEGLVEPGTALELGCGTGADAVYLAKAGFEVTAVDISPLAIERARLLAEQAGVAVRFVQEDVFQFARGGETYDFVYDAGFYHYVRNYDLERLLDLLWRVTRPGSYYLCLAGSIQETAEGGPPRVSEDDLRMELGRAFRLVQLRPCVLESPYRPEGYAGWSCLMERPPVKCSFSK